MAKNTKTNFDEIALSNLWKTVIRLVYVAIITIILTLGYIFLQKDIHQYLNRKVYTEAELLQFNEEAAARQRSIKAEKEWDKVVDGIHLRSGLHDDEHLQLIINTCTSCHSSKLITQNKATREGWHAMIKWMQETQGLVQLGKAEPLILDYLAKYYAPKETGRRKNLDISAIKWYVLSESK